MTQHVGRNFTQKYRLVVDGMGTQGTTKTVKLPVIEVLKEGFRAGDMIIEDSIDMGIAPLNMSFTLLGRPYALVKKQGMGKDGVIPMTLYKSVNTGSDDRAPSKVIIRAGITKSDSGDDEAGKLGETTFDLDVKYYREEFNGDVIYEIDTNPLNQICIINGVDYMAKDRENLGL